MSNPELPSDPSPIDQPPSAWRPVPAADMESGASEVERSAAPDAIAQAMAPPAEIETGTNMPLAPVDHDPLEPPPPRRSVVDEIVGEDYIDMTADSETMRAQLLHTASVLGPLLTERGVPFTADTLVQHAAQLAEYLPPTKERILALADTWVVTEFDNVPLEDAAGIMEHRSGFVVVTPGGLLEYVVRLDVEPTQSTVAYAYPLTDRSLGMLDERPGDPMSTAALSHGLNAIVRSLGITREAFDV